jgi:mono/diheme cytochrome c family protein
MKLWKVGLVLVAAFALSVATLPAAGPDTASSVSSNPTFTKDVLPIFQQHCEACHRPGQMAPFSTQSYEDVRPWARSIKQKTESRYMPPWHLDRTVGEYDPDPSLSDEQIATIAKWVDNGAPKGDPKDAPAPMTWTDDNTWQFGEQPDLIISAPTANIPAIGPDKYPTPSVPSGMTEDRYIKWIQVLPGQPKVVHHVLVFAHQAASANGPRPAADLQNARRGGNNNAPDNPNNAGATNPFNRGAIGNETVTRITEFARGNDGDVYDENVGLLLQAGAVISFEIHYHPNGESAVVDNTKVGIKFFPKGFVPKHLVSTQGISGGELHIAPGDPASRSDSYFTLNQPARLISFQPHMHYRGSAMQLEAILPNGQVQLVTDVPHFIWTWQITYPYKYQPAFPKGTMLHSIAWHDNSAGNKENPDPTAFVGGGPRTVDEMNIGWLDFYYISDEEYAQVSKEQQERQKAKVNTGANQ